MSSSTPPDPRQEAAGPRFRDPSAEPRAADQLLETPPPLDRTSPQFTLRAVLTGMVLGGLLSACNIYAGLKVGLVFGMSITAALLGYGLWTTLHMATGRRIRPWGILENTINQTACSSGAAVASAGLVAHVPALTLLAGVTLPWYTLALWVFSVCMLGIVVAVGVRRQAVVVDRLPFPEGIACAEMLRGIHARGREAAARLLTLFVAAFGSAGICVATRLQWLGDLALPGSVAGVPMRGLRFALSPSPLLLAVGGLIGFRACVSLLIGALVAWAALAPWLVRQGTVAAAEFAPLRDWLVWPGVTLMVVAALTSLAFSWRTMAGALHGAWAARGGGRTPFILGLMGVLLVSVLLQGALFGIPWWAALLAVALSFALALVAARVSGETGITPVASVAKLSQLTIGATVPGAVAPNLMAANVTAGAASQCAELLHDLKCGLLLGASPARQTLAQVCGAAAGSVCGAIAYTWLVPDPARQLLTESLPAPAVQSVKVVAELLQSGLSALPPGVPLAMLIAAGAALALTIAERTVPARWKAWVPSSASIGFAFVFPASYSTTIFAGGLAALALQSAWKQWSSRLLVAACTGLIVGDTLSGLAFDIRRVVAESP